MLTDRLGALLENGLITKDDDPTHAQKAIYSLTEKGIALLPVLAATSKWTQKHYPETRRPEAVALAQGDEQFVKELQARLRKQHRRSP